MKKIRGLWACGALALLLLFGLGCLQANAESSASKSAQNTQKSALNPQPAANTNNKNANASNSTTASKTTSADTFSFSSARDFVRSFAFMPNIFPAYISQSTPDKSLDKQPAPSAQDANKLMDSFLDFDTLLADSSARESKNTAPNSKSIESKSAESNATSPKNHAAPKPQTRLRFEIDSSLCQGVKSCQRAYLAHFEQAESNDRQLLEAKHVLAEKMLSDKTHRDDASIYLSLAELEYKQGGFFALQNIRAFLQAYAQKGGDTSALPKNLAYILRTPASELTLESTLSLMLEGKLDSALFAQGYFKHYAKDTSAFIGIFSKESMQERCMGLITLITQTSDKTSDKTSSKASAPILAHSYCAPTYEALPKLFGFDGVLYWLMPDRLYATSAANTRNISAPPLYALIDFSQTSAPHICDSAAKALDESLAQNLASDLSNAGFGAGDEGLSRLKDFITGGDERMDVEYLGHIDVFNSGDEVPIVRTCTHSAEDKAHGFYEAMTLNPSTLQIDASLSHPIMNISGRIPNLSFVQLGGGGNGGSGAGGENGGAGDENAGKIAGCVRSDDGMEEKVFLFRKDSAPELIAHNRLKKALKQVRKVAPEPSVYRYDFCADSKNSDCQNCANCQKCVNCANCDDLADCANNASKCDAAKCALSRLTP